MAKQSDSKKSPAKGDKPATGGKSAPAPTKGGDMKKGDAKSGDKKGGKK